MNRDPDASPGPATDPSSNRWLQFLRQPSLVRLEEPSREPERHRVDATLWAAEAMHRTANLAQLIAAISHLRQKLPPGVGPRGFEAQTSGLAAAYAELACSAEAGLVPCGALLREVVSGLISLFGGSVAGDVTLELTMSAVSLSPDKRRAMVLIASELVVNALKYAFPAGRAGAIAVRLTCEDGFAALTVADDGVGMNSAAYNRAIGHGLGHGLMGGLTYLLNGTLAPVSASKGLAVTLRFPIG